MGKEQPLERESEATEDMGQGSFPQRVELASAQGTLSTAREEELTRAF